jgi:hypothetical protein
MAIKKFSKQYGVPILAILLLIILIEWYINTHHHQHLVFH